MSLAPIALFVYNRPYHTAKTLEALRANDLADQSQLFVFCDGPKKNADRKTLNAIAAVREVVKSQQWYQQVSIIESDTNKGLADAIVAGVTKIVNEYGKIIVLEDDIVTAKGFLSYMNAALNCYENQEKVMHIGAYMPYTNSIRTLPETFFSRFMSCWGWGTWKASWEQANWDAATLYHEIAKPQVRYQFNLDGVLNFHEQLEQNISGQIHTWAIKWFASIFLNQGLCLYPKVSLTQNIGLDGTGVHCDEQQEITAFESGNVIEVHPIKIKESRVGKRYLKRCYQYGADSRFQRRFQRIYRDYRFKMIKRLKGL